MSSVWVVDCQDTPHTRLRGVTTILNQVIAVLYCDGENRVIHKHIMTKLPGDSGRFPHEIAIQLTAQIGRSVTNGCFCSGR